MHEHLRRCRACDKVKPIESFGINRATPDGIHRYCRECVNARSRQDRVDDPERARARRMRSYYKHRDRERRLGNERQREWREANPEAHRESVKAWVRDNPETSREQKQRMAARRAAAGQPQPGSPQWEAERLIVLERDDGVCGICGGDVDPLAFTIDHIIPIARGGPHEMANLQLAHKLCNNRKYTSCLED